MNATRDGRPLLLILSSGTVGWLLFVAGVYADLVVHAGRTFEELYSEDAVGFVMPSKYLTLLAIAALALGALVAKRSLMKQTADTSPKRFTRSVLRFANLAMIVSLVLAAVAGVAVFMDGFFSGLPSESALVRTLNLYLPIVLYTVLLVTVLLAGFVFLRPQPAGLTEPTDGAGPAGGGPTGGAAPVERQRLLAFAYATPIIAIAVALIFGLIVYDITQTAPEVWIWVIIQAIVAAGIIVGTLCASRAIGSARPVSGAHLGAQNLNFVLSIVAVSVVAIMSLSYGSSAMNRLSSTPYASLNIYEDDWRTVEQHPDGVALDSLRLQADGYGLQRNSPVVAAVHPGGDVLFSAEVNRDGYLSVTEDFAPQVPAGDYSIEMRVSTLSGDDLTLDLEFTMTDAERVIFTDGSHVSYNSEVSRLVSVSAGWILSDLLPAFLLWVIASTIVFCTLSVRNRRD